MLLIREDCLSQEELLSNECQASLCRITGHFSLGSTASAWRSFCLAGVKLHCEGSDRNDFWTLGLDGFCHMSSTAVEGTIANMQMKALDIFQYNLFFYKQTYLALIQKFTDSQDHIKISTVQFYTQAKVLY